MPYNTNNSVPSSDLRDFADNQQTLDEVVNSSSKEVTTRTGKKAKTLAGLQADVVAIGQSASQSAQAAASSAAAAAQSAADAANSAAATGYVDAPFPDVWAPLSDDLRLLAGFAPADTITVAGTSYPLPTKSMTFTRSTTATYIDKAGLLKTAAVNEPRFEKEGILIEGKSTNYMLNSNDPTKWGSSSAITKTVLAADGYSQCPSCKCVISTEEPLVTIVGSAPQTMAVGDPLTISGRMKGNYGSIRLAFLLDSTTTASAYIDVQTGAISSQSAGVIVTSTLLPDGYVAFTATFTIVTAGNYSATITAAKISSDRVIPLNTEYYVQMPQVEKNSVATSYIPTGAAAVTRAPDYLEIAPLGNVGYRLVGDSFARTIACEVSVNKFNPTVNYVDMLANLGAKNDIILRCTPDTVRSYRSSTGPTITNVTIPFNSKLYVQTINTPNSNEVTSYFDGQSNTATDGGPVDASTAGTALRFSGNSNAVFHIRNFRIWHRLLTPTQIRGLR